MSEHANSTTAVTPFRQSLYELLLDERNKSGKKSFINRFTLLLILLNLFVLLLESAPAIYAPYRDLFFAFDVFSVGVFSIEYLLRLYLAPEDPEFANKSSPRLAYMTSVLGLIDLLAIAPFFAGLLFAMDTRLLRVIRLLRILKISQIFIEGTREFIQLNRGRTLRQKVHALLFTSDYGGRLNQAIEFFLIFWIVLSVLSIVLESVASINLHFSYHFAVLDVASFVVFFIEYALRIYAYPEENTKQSSFMSRFNFMRSPSGLLDLMAILPFLLELVLGGTVDLRFLRIVRMTRLLKLGRYSSASDTMFNVIKKEMPVLLAGMFMIVLLVFMMAAFGYMLERDAQPDKFENIPQSIYWAVITLASVGYGDISPVTPGGRLITVFLALVGIGIFAIPAAILASGFTDQMRSRRDQIRHELLVMAREVDFEGEGHQLFVDYAKSHHLSMPEINQIIQQIKDEAEQAESPNADTQSLVLAAGNPEFALAQYRMLVAHLSQLAAISDAGYITRQLQVSGQSTELERTVWDHVEKTRPMS